MSLIIMKKPSPPKRLRSIEEKLTRAIVRMLEDESSESCSPQENGKTQAQH